MSSSSTYRQGQRQKEKNWSGQKVCFTFNVDARKRFKCESEHLISISLTSVNLFPTAISSITFAAAFRDKIKEVASGN